MASSITSNRQISPLEGFNIIKEIGSGQYSTVYRIKNNQTSEYQVVKLMRLRYENQPRKSKTYHIRCNREVNILASMNHPNIVK